MVYKYFKVSRFTFVFMIGDLFYEILPSVNFCPYFQEITFSWICFAFKISWHKESKNDEERLDFIKAADKCFEEAEDE